MALTVIEWLMLYSQFTETESIMTVRECRSFDLHRVDRPANTPLDNTTYWLASSR
jgi:hypothetical protein